MIASTLKLTLAAVALLTFTAPLGAQQPAPQKSPILIEVKIGSSAYIPAGGVKVPPPVTAPSNSDPIILSVVLRSMTAQELKNVKVEAVLYKTSTKGIITETGKVRETLDLNRGEQKVVYANGSLDRANNASSIRYMKRTTELDRPAEEVYGWYVAVYLDGEKIYEKADPDRLVNSEEVKKSLAVAQPRRR